VVLGGHVVIRVRLFMILYQLYHALAVLHLNSYHNHHILPMEQHVICVEWKLMEEFFIAKLANLMHIHIVQSSKIKWRYSFMIIHFIFLFEIITKTNPILYVVFVRNWCKKVNGFTSVNNVILMCMHFAPSFQGKSKEDFIIAMISS
jgi:hypothetical protein